MCGIAGFFGRTPRSANTAAAMLSALRQRGPDAQHAVAWDQDFRRSDGPAHHALLHARLAIIDPRPEADQPMANDDQSVWLCYNGEVYGWSAEAAELRIICGGFFVNAHSTLKFRGSAKELSTMLQELSEIDGAEISVRFSQGADLLLPTAPSEGKTIDESSQWSIDHNAWANPQHLSVTIYLGEGAIKLDELQLPTIRGRMPKDATRDP